MGVMEHLNWSYIQLGLFALAIGGFQVCCISSVFLRRNWQNLKVVKSLAIHWSGSGRKRLNFVSAMR